MYFFPLTFNQQHSFHNVSGASQHALAEETTPEVTKKLFDLNTVAPINLTQALLPHILVPIPQPQTYRAHETPHEQPSSELQHSSSLSEQTSNSQNGGDNEVHQRPGGPQGGCHIVVMGSMAGVVPAPGQAVYSACKTALVGYFGSLQSELAAR